MALDHLKPRPSDIARTMPVYYIGVIPGQGKTTLTVYSVFYEWTYQIKVKQRLFVRSGIRSG